MKYLVVLLALVFVVSPQVGRCQQITSGTPLRTIPARRRNAMSGSEFARQTANLSASERQAAALKELRQGNVPDFLRTLRPVEFSYIGPWGQQISATMWVMPDYLAIGSNEDFLRIPLTYPSATTIANEFGCILPTRKMVDAIYAQATHHLKPQPLPAGPQMGSNAYFLKHQQMIETQRANLPLGELIAGHKKDVVLTNLLNSRPSQIAIYGWHRKAGDPIQPLSTVHGANYADYSHGIRLISRTIWIDGKPRSIFEILQDAQLALLLSDEPLKNPLKLMRASADLLNPPLMAKIEE
jgi:hypothetical protein